MSKDFSRFDERMQKLATHIEQASKDVQEVHVSSRKISAHFQKIESARSSDELRAESGVIEGPWALSPRSAADIDISIFLSAAVSAVRISE